MRTSKVGDKQLTAASPRPGTSRWESLKVYKSVMAARMTHGSRGTINWRAEEANIQRQGKEPETGSQCDEQDENQKITQLNDSSTTSTTRSLTINPVSSRPATSSAL